METKNSLYATLTLTLCSFLLLFFIGHAAAHNWMAPQEAAEQKNPITADKNSIAQGKEIFSDLCITCHGEAAKGLTAKDSGLKKDTTSLVKRLQTHTEGDFHWKITHGKDEMPSFKEDLSDTEIWHIINYIKSIE